MTVVQTYSKTFVIDYYDCRNHILFLISLMVFIELDRRVIGVIIVFVTDIGI